MCVNTISYKLWHYVIPYKEKNVNSHVKIYCHEVIHWDSIHIIFLGMKWFAFHHLVYNFSHKIQWVLTMWPVGRSDIWCRHVDNLLAVEMVQDKNWVILVFNKKIKLQWWQVCLKYVQTSLPFQVHYISFKLSWLTISA